jgi:hypothetical protein
VDPAQHDKRHMDKITVVPNSFCQGRTHLWALIIWALCRIPVINQAPILSI